MEESSLHHLITFIPDEPITPLERKAPSASSLLLPIVNLKRSINAVREAFSHTIPFSHAIVLVLVHGLSQCLMDGESLVTERDKIISTPSGKVMITRVKDLPTNDRLRIAEPGAEIPLPFIAREGASASIIYTNLKRSKEIKRLASVLKEEKNAIFILMGNLTNESERELSRNLNWIYSGKRLGDEYEKKRITLFPSPLIEAVNLTTSGAWRLISDRTEGDKEVLHGALFKERDA